MALFDHIRDGLHEGAGLSRDEAERLAVLVIQWGGDAGFAGARFYWPAKARTMTRAELSAAVRADHGCLSVKEICEKHDLSAPTVYRLLFEES
ncbi:MAG: hypothetical protein AAGI88_15490 [Pseudomonadota bacterium]